MIKKIGVLALQGAFSRHMEMIESLYGRGMAVRPMEIRQASDIRDIDALVIPGGESTTISKMMVRWELFDPIRDRMAHGLPVYGTCAGLILLAQGLVEWNSLPRLGGLDVQVARNAYGRQADSFEAELDIHIPGAKEFEGKPFKGIFIRAPKIVSSPSSKVDVLCSFAGLPVLVRQGNLLAGTFHPELSGDLRLHAWFFQKIVGASALGKRKE